MSSKAFLQPSFTGDTVAGHRWPAQGIVRNVGVRTTGYGAAEVTYAVTGDNLSAYEVGVFVDGELVSRRPATEGMAGVAGLSEGEHTINLHINRVGETWPNYHGDPEGRRAYLQWERCADADCVGYRVYWDAGAGGAADILLAEIGGVTIEEAVNRRNHSPGRVTWYGGFTLDTPVNDVITLWLGSGGSYTYSCAAGSGGGDFGSGHSLILPYGVVVEVQDAVDAYGSLFLIPVGPPTWYLSDELAPGDYKFVVVAVDAAGHESWPGPARLVRIYDVPAPLTGVNLVWMDDVMYIHWDAVAAVGAGIDKVNVYANVSRNLEGGLLEHIIEDRPYAVHNATDGVTAFAYTDTHDGVLTLYLRPMDAQGVERRSVELVEVSIPPTPAEVGVVLGSPTNVVLAARASGSFEVSWDYRWDEDHDDLAGFEVALASESGEQVFTGVIQVLADAGLGYPVSTFSLALPGPYAGVWYAKVRAYSIGESPMVLDSGEASAEADIAPPWFDSRVYGVPQ